MLVTAEFSDQLGEAEYEDPSLKMAVAVNCRELFSFIELGPLMARELKVGATFTMVTSLSALGI